MAAEAEPARLKAETATAVAPAAKKAEEEVDEFAAAAAANSEGVTLGTKRGSEGEDEEEGNCTVAAATETEGVTAGTKRGNEGADEEEGGGKARRVALPVPVGEPVAAEILDDELGSTQLHFALQNGGGGVVNGQCE